MQDGELVTVQVKYATERFVTCIKELSVEVRRLRELAKLSTKRKPTRTINFDAASQRFIRLSVSSQLGFVLGCVLKAVLLFVGCVKIAVAVKYA